MWQIALVDDKEYGKQQILGSMPAGVEYNLEYFDSYRKALGKKFDILFLDYYLDKDGLRGEDIIDQLEADVIIGFSSVPSCNERFLNLGASFAVEKSSSSTGSRYLEDILNSIMKNDK